MSMENKKLTAVECFMKNIPDLGSYIPVGVSLEIHAKYQQALELEKEQKKEDYEEGYDAAFNHEKSNFEQYYQNTYGKD